MKKEEKFKLTKKEWRIARILVDEMVSWESTEKATNAEIKRLIKRLSREFTISPLKGRR